MSNLQEEIKRINKLMNESEVKEGLLDNIKDLITRIGKSEPIQKIKDKLIDLFDGDTEESDVKKTITTSDDSFYESVLDCLGAPKTDSNMLFLYAWRQAEGGTAKNNPFNTTYKKGLKSDQYSDYNSAGVKNYETKQIGINSTCETLKLNRYKDIVESLKSGNAFEKIENMKSLKTWGTGDLLKQVVQGYKEGSSPKPNPIA